MEKLSSFDQGFITGYEELLKEAGLATEIAKRVSAKTPRGAPPSLLDKVMTSKPAYSAYRAMREKQLARKQFHNMVTR